METLFIIKPLGYYDVGYMEIYRTIDNHCISYLDLRTLNF